MRPLGVVVLRDSVKVNSMAPIGLIVLATDHYKNAHMRQHFIICFHFCQNGLCHVFSLCQNG